MEGMLSLVDCNASEDDDHKEWSNSRSIKLIQEVLDFSNSLQNTHLQLPTHPIH